MNTRKSAAIVAFAAAIFTAAACSSAPADMTVNGTVTVEDNPAAGDYPPVEEGSQVTITDPSGKVVAVTGLNDNASQGATFTLSYGFHVKVPEGISFYGVSVNGLGGTEHYTQAQMKAGPALCSGDACE